MKRLLRPHGSSGSLLYRATRDGQRYVDFHSRCDNKGATAVLWRTDDNRVFGGFTSVSWDSVSKGWKNDPKAFIFSLDKQLVFPVQDSNKAIMCSGSWGPNFGGGGSNDLSSESEPFFENSICYASKQFYKISADDKGNSVLTGKSRKFTPVEIEVFLIS